MEEEGCFGHFGMDCVWKVILSSDVEVEIGFEVAGLVDSSEASGQLGFKIGVIGSVDSGSSNAQNMPFI